MSEKFESLGLPAKEVIYGQGIIEDGRKDLRMLLYTPSKQCFRNKYPLIIMVHGGGFGGGYPEHMESLFVSFFIEKGFFIASPAYRLTYEKGYVPRKWSQIAEQKHNPPPEGAEMQLSEYISKDVYETAYRSTRDVKSAIRWLTKNADRYNIDKDNVFLFGESAGALISLTLYLSPSKYFFKDDEDVIQNDAALSTVNPDITPFNIKTTIGLSGSDQVLNTLQKVYYPNLWNDPKTYKNLFLIHGDRDSVILDKFPIRLYNRYLVATQKNKIKYLNVPGAWHVPVTEKVSGMNMNQHMLYHILQFINSDNILCPNLKSFKNQKNVTVYKPMVQSNTNPIIQQDKYPKNENESSSSINIILIVTTIICIITIIGLSISVATLKNKKR